MAGEAYIAVGSNVLFNGEAGASVALSAEGVSNGAGRVSAQYDLGASPRPYLFKWSCEVQWQATPTQYATLDIYIATAPDGFSTKIDGDPGATDAALGDIDMIRNMKHIGSVASENAAASEVCRTSGIFECFHRYLSVVIVNSGGAAINATDSNFRFDMQPVAQQGQ